MKEKLREGKGSRCDDEKESFWTYGWRVLQLHSRYLCPSTCEIPISFYWKSHYIGTTTRVKSSILSRSI